LKHGNISPVVVPDFYGFERAIPKNTPLVLKNCAGFPASSPIRELKRQSTLKSRFLKFHENAAAFVECALTYHALFLNALRTVIFIQQTRDVIFLNT
jgi:hypothetical protein